jgi:hypothetical protein
MSQTEREWGEEEEKEEEEDDLTDKKVGVPERHSIYIYNGRR